jgi:ABC-2 type transport system permease protein/sodium transport system permease protein
LKPEVAYGALAAIFPVFFLTGSLIGRMVDLSIERRLMLNALLTAAIFGGLPLVVTLWRRVPILSAFQLRRPTALSIAGAIIAGAAAWPLAHEVVLLLSQAGISAIGVEHLERAHGIINAWKRVPFPVRLACIAIVPAVFEELCFRGFLLGSIRRRAAPWAAILISAFAFGLFHILVGGTLAIERLAPSTLLGVALGWIALRTGSVIPGMAFHILNNGMIVALAEYEQVLKDTGWDLSDRHHLPAAWIATSLTCVIVGLFFVWAGSRTPSDRMPAQLAIDSATSI